MLRTIRLSTLAACLLFSAISCQTVTREDNRIVTERGSYDDAKLERLLAEADRYPKRPDLHYQIAQVHFQNADFYESAKALKHAIGLAPEDSKYYYHLGRVYLRSGDKDLAEEAFLKSTSFAGDRYSGPYAALGYVQALMKKHDQALVAFEKCVELEPENPEYYYFLGSLLDIQGDDEGTIRNYSEYLTRGGKRFRRKVWFVLESLGVRVEKQEVDAPVDPTAADVEDLPDRILNRPLKTEE